MHGTASGSLLAQAYLSTVLLFAGLYTLEYRLDVRNCGCIIHVRMPPSQYIYISLTHTLSLIHMHTLCLSLTHTHIHAYTHIHSYTHSHAHTQRKGWSHVVDSAIKNDLRSDSDSDIIATLLFLRMLYFSISTGTLCGTSAIEPIAWYGGLTVSLQDGTY